MTIPDRFPQRRALYLRHLAEFLGRLRVGSQSVLVPPRTELRRRLSHGHYHNVPELFLQVGGATRFRFAGGSHQLATGEICVMPRGVSHAEQPVDTATPYTTIVCMYQPTGFSLHYSHASARRQILPHRLDQFPLPQGQDLFRHLDDLADCDDFAGGERQEYRQCLLRAFLMAVRRKVEAMNEPAEHPGSLKIERARELVLAHLPDSTLTVRKIARDLGCSADYLSRRFHQESGRTLIHFLNEQRVLMAKEALRDLSLNISEVGWGCGFSSPSYFTRVFRRHTGATPGDYRKRWAARAIAAP
jgi:AraC-like DNA-binding protein